MKEENIVLSTRNQHEETSRSARWKEAMYFAVKKERKELRSGFSSSKCRVESRHRVRDE